MIAPTFDEIKVLKEIEDSIVLDLALSYPSEAAMQVRSSIQMYSTLNLAFCAFCSNVQYTDQR